MKLASGWMLETSKKKKRAESSALFFWWPITGLP